MILTIHLSALAYVLWGGESTEYFDLVEESLAATGLDSRQQEPEGP